MEKDKALFCKCGCSNGIKFETFKDEEDVVYISFVTDMFYAIQDKFFKRLKEKIKRIWYVLANKEYTYFDIAVKKEELKNIIDEL